MPRYAEHIIERVLAEPDERKRERSGHVQQRELDAFGGEQPMSPMHGDRCYEHHRDHERRADRAEEAECDEETAGDLADRGSSGERGSWSKAHLLEELAGAAKPMASKPFHQLLGSMRGHEEADNDPSDEQSEAQCLNISCVRTHGILPSFNIGY